MNAPAVQKAARSLKTPWLLATPIPTQFIAAFLLGVEAMLLWQVSMTVGMAAIGSPANLIAFAIVLLGIVLLRTSALLDNKDLFVFVDLFSFAAVWGGQIFAKTLFETFLSWQDIAISCGIAGFGAIAIMATFRLIFQLLYSLL
jgi:serine/threonine-protein kinase